jgi:adenylate cyclase
MRERPLILVVDDIADNVEIARLRLESQGYEVAAAGDGEEALQKAAALRPDLLLLDWMMPKLDGLETVRRLKADPDLRFIPVILLTAKSETGEVVRGLDAGADDYLTKPFEHAALLARVRAMLRIKALNDQVKAQAAALAELNATLEERVAAQVAELERVGRLKRFLPPQVVDVVLAEGAESLLESHRRDIAVLFCDLRGFTAFTEGAEPEEVMRVIGEYHAVVGPLVQSFGGTLDHYAGDGVMVFFNDPVPCDDPEMRAVGLADAIRGAMRTLAGEWRRRGHALGCGMGIAQGYATLGRIGFADRMDYAAIGTVTNLAARLCAEAADGQILVSERIAAAVEGRFALRPVGGLTLKGIARPVQAYDVVATEGPASEVA